MVHSGRSSGWQVVCFPLAKISSKIRQDSEEGPGLKETDLYIILFSSPGQKLTVPNYKTQQISQLIEEINYSYF